MWARVCREAGGRVRTNMFVRVMNLEGIAANDAHRDWLDSIVDRCVMYKAGHEQGYAKDTLGGDPEFVAKASRYFGGTMMDARRWLMPGAGGDGEEDGGDDEVDVDDDDEE